MTSVEAKMAALSRSEKDELLLNLLQKKQESMKRAHENRMADETKRKKHIAQVGIINSRKYKEDPTFRERVLERKRQRYWEKKRKKEAEDSDPSEISGGINIDEAHLK